MYILTSESTNDQFLFMKGITNLVDLSVLVDISEELSIPLLFPEISWAQRTTETKFVIKNGY